MGGSAERVVAIIKHLIKNPDEISDVRSLFERGAPSEEVESILLFHACNILEEEQRAEQEMGIKRLIRSSSLSPQKKVSLTMVALAMLNGEFIETQDEVAELMYHIMDEKTRPVLDGVAIAIEVLNECEYYENMGYKAVPLFLSMCERFNLPASQMINSFSKFRKLIFEGKMVEVESGEVKIFTAIRDSLSRFEE